ncbi:monosaccharide ABC transporter membrane protein (CUT2 family) [Mobilisporobacter senegalensis]|uniref:Monosaccharide ABC transporter membrane protein (CUT2 family) n=1 Tax=Mobilisporobacter senegalensis TaxID=1329262 RepID=A0A3N1XQX2_9FIRM|nr:ABC transporter permease [Mobilisporobacter senegalensis]ROR29074.1 monosaccharide ABC transporter membrane protein (CUT2 family) [Mobilisporobacter senegalensis]
MEKKSFDIKKLTSSREMSLVLILIVLSLFIQLRNSSFLSITNINDLITNAVMLSILAVGMMFVLLIGGIDISIGSTIAFSGMAVALILRSNPGIPTILSFILGIIIGTLCGLLVGLIIAKGKVIPIIATLGLMNIFRGATYLIADNQWVAAYQLPEGLKAFATGKFLGINNMIIVAIVVYIIFAYFIKYTRTGRKIYAVGSNVDAAKVSGINIDRIKILVYSIMGGLSGLVSILWISKYASAQGDAATGIEMDVIAACVIGGVSLNGGKGTVLGVILGTVTLGILNNALPLINISPFWQDAIKGLVIIAAIIINTITQRTMDRNNLKRREI